MAAISITPANVGVAEANLTSTAFQAGEAITQGQPFYYDSVTQKAMVATSDDTEAKAKVVGIALTSASIDGHFMAMPAPGKLIKPGATLSKGVSYYLGSAGAIVPYGDLSASDWVTFLFRAVDTSTAKLNIDATGIQL